MIAILSGIIAEKLGEVVVLDVAGVGYGLLVASEDYSALETGTSAKVYIYEHIRENSHELFGFLRLETKALFELLLGVNGIGPKMALNMLSIGSGSQVRQAIASGDIKFIQQANGVGKRVAERVVVDLKDKVGLSGIDLQNTGILQSDSTILNDEAVEALVSLGYSTADAVKALAAIDAGQSTEDRIKQVLKGSK